VRHAGLLTDPRLRARATQFRLDNKPHFEMWTAAFRDMEKGGLVRMLLPEEVKDALDEDMVMPPPLAPQCTARNGLPRGRC
jgi:hypothetical protein